MTLLPPQARKVKGEVLLLLFMLFLALAGATQPSGKASIVWDVQLNTTTAIFQSIGMCKGMTDETKNVGFIGGDHGSIWRTLDGQNWQSVAQFSKLTSWYGIYCFPDATRVIAVGSAVGTNANELVVSWSFDGGSTWSNPGMLFKSRHLTWLQSVHFYNDTHGIILPSNPYNVPLAFFTTNGGKTASDWKVSQLKGIPSWEQSHSIFAFPRVTKTLAVEYNSDSEICSTDTAGMSWQCDPIDQDLLVASFVTPYDAVGVDNAFRIYSTRDGGAHWNHTSTLLPNLGNSISYPSDMVWIPNSDVMILVGGSEYPNYNGNFAYSLDRGMTWTESVPDLPSTMFTSVDWVAQSEKTFEVWTVGTTQVSSTVFHATVTIG